MKHVVVAVAAIAAVVAATTGVAASSGGDEPYELARTWQSPLGNVYGPVQAGPEVSVSYGFIVK